MGVLLLEPQNENGGFPVAFPLNHTAQREPTPKTTHPYSDVPFGSRCCQPLLKGKPNQTPRAPYEAWRTWRRHRGADGRFLAARAQDVLQAEVPLGQVVLRATGRLAQNNRTSRVDCPHFSPDWLFATSPKSIKSRTQGVRETNLKYPGHQNSPAHRISR